MEYQVNLQKIVGGGQTMADVKLADGTVKKAFVWGGLPEENVKLRIIKKRAGIIEAVVEEVVNTSPQRVAPADPDSFLSTSPWQIYDYQFELQQKAQLIMQAFADHKLSVVPPIVKTDNQQYSYRNKMEFAWWWDKQAARLELAVYRRGAKGKIAVEASSLARPSINRAAQAVRDWLNQQQIEARQLKTLLLRSNQADQVVAQLYVTNADLRLPAPELSQLGLIGLEIIYSNPKSPASVISARLQAWGELKLTDQLGELMFSYPAESFFQINLPVYQLALAEIKTWLIDERPVVDLYSGVGTIGLSVAGQRPLKLVEINPAAVAEMTQNIQRLGFERAEAILASAETVLGQITPDCQLIVDPPRAGLHQKVIDQILRQRPARVIYLSCNVATQARDVAMLAESYQIKAMTGFNFFPKTPHIENLVVLDLR